MKTAMIVELETRFVLLWTGLFISLGLNVFICYSMSLWLKWFIRSYLQAVSGETTGKNLMGL